MCYTPSFLAQSPLALHTPLCAKAGACVLSDVACKGFECEGGMVGEQLVLHSQGLAPPPPLPPSRHGPSFPFPFPLFVSPPCWQLDWCCVVGSFCQGRGVHSAHSSCCSVTVRVFGGCSSGCRVFLFVLPGPVAVCSVRQHLTASCGLALLGSPHSVGFSPPLVFFQQ